MKRHTARELERVACSRSFWRIRDYNPQCVEGCVPCSCGFLSLRLKFFHQLAKSFLSLIDSVSTACDAVRGPPAPAAAVEGPLVFMPGEGLGGSATPAYCMRGDRGEDGVEGGRICGCLVLLWLLLLPPMLLLLLLPPMLLLPLPSPS